jgi:DNA-binding response OmpR family regulator
VLIVEDEATLAQTIELYLRHEGYRTERAADGQRGVELFRAARPDLVLLDLGLPKLDGLEVLRKIRAASDVPVVILTAREEEVDELLGLGMGADDYLVKPVSARKLLARVKVALRRARPLAGPTPEVLRVGPLEVDAYRVEVRCDGQPARPHAERVQAGAAHGAHAGPRDRARRAVRGGAARRRRPRARGRHPRREPAAQAARRRRPRGPHPNRARTRLRARGPHAA